RVRYEYYRHNVDQIISGTTHVKFNINGVASNYDGGLNSWNTENSIFSPPEIGGVYTIKLEAEIQPVGGNPIFHIDFMQSGSDTTTGESFRHKQSVEVTVRNTGPQRHLHAVFTTFVDEDLFVSGGILMAATSGPAITISSASLFIKEG